MSFCLALIWSIYSINPSGACVKRTFHEKLPFEISLFFLKFILKIHFFPLSHSGKTRYRVLIINSSHLLTSCSLNIYWENFEESFLFFLSSPGKNNRIWNVSGLGGGSGRNRQWPGLCDLKMFWTEPWAKNTSFGKKKKSSVREPALRKFYFEDLSAQASYF